MKILIGIDPGLSGGVATMTLDRSGNVMHVAATVMPVAGHDINIAELANWLDANQALTMIGDLTIEAYIEKVASMPGQGVKSMFSFGYNTGMVHGFLAAYNIPRNLVTPQAWKKQVLAGTAKDKEAAIEYCSRVYPRVSLLASSRSKKAHNGIADAICIAEYARLKK